MGAGSDSSSSSACVTSGTVPLESVSCARFDLAFLSRFTKQLPVFHEAVITHWATCKPTFLFRIVLQGGSNCFENMLRPPGQVCTLRGKSTRFLFVKSTSSWPTTVEQLPNFKALPLHNAAGISPLALWHTIIFATKVCGKMEDSKEKVGVLAQELCMVPLSACVSSTSSAGPVTAIFLPFSRQH